MKTKKERVFGTTTGLERLAYAFGDLGSNFVWTFCSSFLTLYYTDSVLVSAGLVGTIMLICRIFDGISDIFCRRSHRKDQNEARQSTAVVRRNDHPTGHH